MSAIRAAGPTGLRTSIAGTRTRRTASNDFGSLLKNKARTTSGLNRKQMAAYDKQMLAAVQDTKPQRLSEADKLTVAAVVPGALGVLQPSGTDMAKATPQDPRMASMDLQNTMQKQQRTMQMMSSLSKAQHDTATAIISNIRA